MAETRPDYRDRIVRDPNILVGKPTVRGTRIPVELVLKHLEENPDLADLFAAFPRLTEDDVKACLAYAREAVEGRRLRHARGEATGRTVQAGDFCSTWMSIDTANVP